MMKVENIETLYDIERYVEGSLNDFELGISTKEETLCFLLKLIAHTCKVANQAAAATASNSSIKASTASDASKPL